MFLHNSSSRNGDKATEIYHNTDNGCSGKEKLKGKFFEKHDLLTRG